MTRHAVCRECPSKGKSGVRVNPSQPQGRHPIRHWLDRPGVRVLAWTAAATGLVVGLLLMVDGNWLRAPLEKRLSNASGRPVSIESVELRWTPGPRLQLHNVAVGSGTSGEKELLTARGIGARVSLWAALRGRLELIELQVSGAGRSISGAMRMAPSTGNAQLRHRDRPIRMPRFRACRYRSDR
jgi:hypothetical protein